MVFVVSMRRCALSSFSKCLTSKSWMSINQLASQGQASRAGTVADKKSRQTARQTERQTDSRTDSQPVRQTDEQPGQTHSQRDSHRKTERESMSFLSASTLQNILFEARGVVAVVRRRSTRRGSLLQFNIFNGPAGHLRSSAACPALICAPTIRATDPRRSTKDQSRDHSGHHTTCSWSSTT